MSLLSGDRNKGEGQRLLMWDWPVRLFHWTLVLCIAALWWTGTQRTLDWHRLAGYTLAALLIFRLGWGVIGSGTARFAQFVRGPRAVVDYVRGHLLGRGAAVHFGHNPLGGWSVVAMLATLVAQVSLGMVSVDVDGIESGPFSYLVEFETGRKAAQLHHFLFNILLGLMALHLFAVTYYLLVKRENLVGPMVTGKRRWAGEGAHPSIASSRRALLLLLASVAIIWGVVYLWGRA